MAAIETEEILCAKYRTKAVVMKFYGIYSYKTFAKKIKAISHLIPIRGLLSPENLKILVAHLKEA